jgi:hypothetical protein
MKKITLLLMMMLLSITAFSQVEIVENFDSTPDWTLPTGWTASTDPNSSPTYNTISFFQCGGVGKSVQTGANTDAGSPPWTIENILTTPNYTGITNATDLTVSFSINVFEEGFPWLFPITQSAPVTDWGTVTLEYSVDGGLTWITAVTIDNSDLTYVDTNTCTIIPATNLGALSAGNDFQARFVTNLTNIAPQNFSTYVILDNISITQVATTPPNCNSPLISPLDGSVGTDLNDTITWQAATGIPTGYYVSIGTTSGGTEILNAASTNNTSYSLSGLGLTYATEYFVNIIPYNGFGPATIGCTEQTFTTRNAPIEGATCSNPYIITTFPYVGAGSDTSIYENNINEGPCGGWSGAYIEGYDVFYEITPATDISINIALAAISSNGAAIHVFEGCPDTATDCVAFIGDDWSNSPPYTLELQEVVLSAGNSYFIVLSSGGFDSSFTYGTLLVTQNSCISPQFTLTPVEACATGEFTIDVDVTYMGDATSLTLTDDLGNSYNNINSTGIINVGPYASTTTVELTLTSNDDGSCSYTDSTFYYCPPSNDDCGNAIDLTTTINTDNTCTLFTSATNAGATESVSDPINCNFTNNNDVWFSFVASAETLILEYLNVVSAIGSGGTNQSTELLEGNCGTFTSLGCFTNTNYITLNNLTIGNTYYIRNTSSSVGEYAQNFDICLKTAPAPPANDECSNATVLTLSTDENCDNLLSGTTVGGTISAENTCNAGYTQFWKDVWYVFTATETGLYKFSFNRTGWEPGADYNIYSGSCGTLVLESPYCGHGNEYNAEVHSMNSGESLYIMVRSGDNGPGIDFDLCVFKLPPPAANNDCSTPTVLLASTDANGNNAISGDFANSYPSPEACDVGGKTIWYSFTAAYTGLYHFNLTPGVGYPYYSVFNTDDCSQTSNNYVPNSGCYGSGLLDTDLVAGNTYLISVYSFSNNTTESFDLLVYPDASLSVETNNFETFKYYPNPVVNTLTIEAKNTISSVSIYNIVGQQVQFENPNNLKTTVNMDELKDGVYFVTITINNSSKTIKIIKK